MERAEKLCVRSKTQENRSNWKIRILKETLEFNEDLFQSRQYSLVDISRNTPHLMTDMIEIVETNMKDVNGL